MLQIVKYLLFLPLHVGVCSLQFPDTVQIVKGFPYRECPELHVNVAVVSTKYLPSVAGSLS